MQDQRLHQVLARVLELSAALREQDAPQDALDIDLLTLNLPASDEPAPVLLRHAQA